MKRQALMRRARELGALALLLAGSLWSAGAVAQNSGSDATASPPLPPPPSAPQSTWQPDNRLILSADGATLTGANGGAGGSITYLGELSPALLLGLGAEYQHLATAYWGFGSVNAAFNHALTANSRWDLHFDAHEGSGNTGQISAASPGHPFRYSIEAAGLGMTAPGGFAVDVEERQFDVDTSHGSLPKVTLSKSWGPHWLTTAAYAESIGGNLDTEYAMARVDFYGRGFNVLGGASVGRVTPAVVNLAGVLQQAAKHLSEPFLGVTKSIQRVDVTVLADDLRLAGITHFTLTLNCLLHLQ